MSTRSLFTSESFNALSVTSAGGRDKSVSSTSNADLTESFISAISHLQSSVF